MRVRAGSHDAVLSQRNHAVKKYFLFVLAAMAVLLMPTASYAGTCNASYVDSLPQTSGSVGAIPPDSPGQTPLGYITHIEATGGPSISWTYTPTVGSPVTSTINFGASSGIVCTSNQVGGFTGPKVYGLYWQNYPAMTTQLVINGSTAPDHLLTCTGMEGNGSSGGNYFSSNDGLQKIWAGPGTEQLSWAGYNTVTGSIHQNSFDMNGSCRIGPSNSSPSFAHPTASSDTHQILHLYAYGSGGITNVEFFVDGVSKGMDSLAPYDLQVVGVPPGPHTLSAKAAFPIGTASTFAYTVMFAPYKVATGNNFACAIVENGSLKCWGRNNYGQLGINSAVTSTSTPTYVYGGSVTPSPGPALAWVQDVSAGLEDACAVNYGGVACWGRNLHGILGVAPGTLASSNVPLQVIAQGSGVTNVQVGDGYACARYSNGNVACWGDGQFGQLGNGSTTATNITPTIVAATVTKVVVGRYSTYFLIGSDVWSTGRNQYGQLGNGTTTNKSLATRIFNGGVTDLWAGKYHGLAMVNGSLMSWGSDNTGELGNGMGGTGIIQTLSVHATAFNGLSVADVVGGDGTTCVVTTTQGVKCVGYNGDGELGLGFTSTMELTAQAPSVYASSVWSMSSGWTDICAFNSGHYKCAGDNTYGQIGDPAAGNPEISPHTVLGL